MAKPKFSIIHNLEKLSEEERAQYLRDASEYFGWDPNLGALDALWINDEVSGLRKLVPYARRGSTDIWRDTHDVEIKSIEQIEVPGTATFRATAVRTYLDATKALRTRQEIAIGSHSTVGLTGEKLAAAIMTAETRAGRRVTLKFIGGGLLDDVEVNTPGLQNSAPASSLATLAGSPVVLPPPQVPPSSLPGKVVETTIDHDKGTITHVKEIVSGIEPRPEKGFPGIDPAAPQAAPSVEQMQQDAAEFLKNKVNPEPEKAPRKKRSPRKRGSVDIASPGQEVVEPTQHEPYLDSPKQVEIPVGLIDKDGKITPAVENPVPVSQPMASVPVPVPTITEAKAEPVAAQPQAPAIPAEKAKEYRDRLKTYTNDILPKGGMMPSDRIGGVTMKLRKFAAIQTGAADASALTVEQWEDLFDFLDGFKGTPSELVQYIDKAIGAA